MPQCARSHCHTVGGDSGNHMLLKEQVVELLQAKMLFCLQKFLRARQKGDSMKSLFKTVALITFFSVLTRIAGFFFRIYLSRVIGAESLGMYQVASSIFMVLLTVVSSGIPLIISRMGAGFRAKNQFKKESSLTATALVFTLIISVVLCLIVFLFRNLFSKLFTDERCMEILITLLPAIVFSAVYSVFRGALWGQGNYFALCVSELFEQIVRIFVCVLMIGAGLSVIENALSVGWSMTIACVASMIFVILLFFIYGGKLSKPSNKIFRPLLKQSTPITSIRIAGSFIQPLVALIIPARMMAIGYTSSQALALYGVAVGMTLPLLFVPTTVIGSLSTALIPDVSTAVAQGNQKHIENRIRSSIIFALFISALFVPVYMGVGEVAGQFLYNNALSGSLLVGASWIMVPLGITNITSALLNSLGLEVKSFVNYLVGSIIMFIAMWFLPQFVGINALVWSMGIGFVIIAILNTIMLKRKIKIDLHLLKPICLLTILIVPCAALTSFITSLCSYVFPQFITLCIGGMVGVVTFTLLCGVFNLIDIRSFLITTSKRLSLDKIFIKLKFKKKTK